MTYTAILAAWLHYYIATEEFDRSHPGCWSRREPDCWFPHDSKLSLANAYRLRSHVYQVLGQTARGVDVAEARYEAGHMTYTVQKRLLATLRSMPERKAEIDQLLEDIRWAQ